ncbi:MAG: phospholipase D family protein [Clostridiaceae bacterium]|nr:phospholipase D family protein [Clostridiaceae bacterium]
MKRVLILYFIYVLITGIVIFAFHSNNDNIYFENNEVERFWGEEIGQDRVALIEDRYYSGISRVNLIENAQETLDIAYYTIHEGVASKIFFGTILEAADRGVQVRVLVDGIFHNLRGSSKDVQYALVNHPNIELKFYESFNLLKPWTWNNRLHDKYIIADNKLAMIGGRNIGDKYFLQDYHGEIVNDRDVVIVNTDTNKPSDSVIKDMRTYFNTVWDHKFSEYPIKKLRYYQIQKGEEKEKYLKKFTEKLRYNRPEIFNHTIDWYNVSVPTNKITLIHNPITRLNKEPWILAEIARLMENAEKSIFIQSPYIIPTKQMMQYVAMDSIQSKQTVLLTNSIAASPNYFAMAGYRNNRKKIVDHTTYLYEYHGDGSIHGKSYVIDNRISLVGTFNVDARSAFLSTESMVVIDSNEFSGVLKKEINELVKESLVVGEDYTYQENPLIEEGKVPRTKSLIIKMLSIFAYFLDFLL